MMDVLTEILTRSRKQENGLPHGLSRGLLYSLKGHLQLCQNFRTISLINVMLKVILNRLKPQAEEIIAEEQAGLRAGRSTAEQIFNLRIPCEKCLQHQQHRYRVFTDLQKAFDRVLHAVVRPPCGNTISVQT